MIEKNIITFNSIALLYLLFKELDTNYEKYLPIQKASIAILGIAATQYSISTYLYDSNKKIAEDIRYIDWLFTTPLLLYTYWKLANENGYKSDFKFLAISVITMVILGYIAEHSDNTYTIYAISMIPYIYIIYHILEIQKMFKEQGKEKHAQLGNFFIYGWVLYPAAFYLPDNSKYMIYSIADFINKGLYSIMLYEVLSLK